MAKEKPPEDVSRYTMLLGNSQQDALVKLTKDFKLTQREILEVLIDHADLNVLGPIFKQMREDKVAGREQKKAILKKLSSLDPDTLKAIDKMVVGRQGRLSA